MHRPFQPIVSDMSPYDINFFHDFILFLERLKNKPIKRTQTGAISITDISDLMETFKTQERLEEYKKYGWHLRREDELDFLTQMKIIAEAMFLTYKRRGLLILSRNGLGFLNNLDANNQYQQMVLHYWYRVNWEYFNPSINVINITLSEYFQQKQNSIWHYLLEAGNNWVDYKEFCRFLENLFTLGFSIDKNFNEEEHLFFEIKLILFKRNLERFGCVEVIESTSKDKWRKEIVKFRSTHFGLKAYSKALFENYL